jgi:hypothetical protein
VSAHHLFRHFGSFCFAALPLTWGRATTRLPGFIVARRIRSRGAWPSGSVDLAHRGLVWEVSRRFPRNGKEKSLSRWKNTLIPATSLHIQTLPRSWDFSCEFGNRDMNARSATAAALSPLAFARSERGASSPLADGRSAACAAPRPGRAPLPRYARLAHSRGPASVAPATATTPASAPARSRSNIRVPRMVHQPPDRFKHLDLDCVHHQCQHAYGPFFSTMRCIPRG